MPLAKGSRRKAVRAVRQADWTKMDRMTDADIEHQIQENPDAARETSKVPKEKWRLVLPMPDVHAIRIKLGMTQENFAVAFGVSAATIRNWEQGRREAHGPARVLLMIIEQEPQAVLRALGRTRGRSRSARSAS